MLIIYNFLLQKSCKHGCATITRDHPTQRCFAHLVPGAIAQGYYYITPSEYRMELRSFL